MSNAVDEQIYGELSKQEVYYEMMKGFENLLAVQIDLARSSLTQHTECSKALILAMRLMTRIQICENIAGGTAEGNSELFYTDDDGVVYTLYDFLTKHNAYTLIDSMFIDGFDLMRVEVRD